MQELLDKQLDGNENQHDEEQEMETSSEKAPDKDNVHRSLTIDPEVKENMDLVIEELKQHKLFQQQKQLEKGEKNEVENNEEENDAPIKTRARSNAFIQHFEPKDKYIKSIVQLRNMVLAAKNSGELDSIHEYHEEEGFLSKFKKSKSSAIKGVLNKGKKTVINKAKEKAKEKLVDEVGDTIADTADFASDAVGKMANASSNLHEALKNKNVEAIKQEIIARNGESTLTNFVSKIAEWIVSKFGGKSGNDLAKGLSVISQVISWIGPVGHGIQSVKNGVDTVIKTYKLVKNINEKTSKEIADDAVKVVESGIETVSKVVDIADSVSDMFNVVGGVASVIPIIGSAINIALKGVQFVKKIYDTFHSLRLMYFGKKQLKKLMSKEFMSKFKRSKSILRIKYEETDYKAIESRRAQLESKLITEGLSDEEMEEYEHLQSVRLYTNLGSYNEKRVIRSLILVGEKLVTIGAEIANIVGVATQGAGTAVGTALKTAVTVEKYGRKAFNFVKQLGRDYGPEAIFDKSKKSSAKKKTYLQNSYMLLNRVAMLPAYRDDVSDIKDLYEESKLMFKVADVNVMTLAKKKNLTEVRDYLVAAMKKRE